VFGFLAWWWVFFLVLVVSMGCFNEGVGFGARRFLQKIIEYEL